MATTSKRTIMTLIDRAIELIEAGWCKGVTKDTRGGQPHYCLMGAVFQATNEYTGDPDLQRPLQKAAIAHITKTFLATRPNEPKHIRLWQFNDRTATTKRDVIGLLHDAHQQLEATP